MAFCANCGTEVVGRFCGKCGAAAPAAPPVGNPAAAPSGPSYTPPQSGGYAPPPPGGYPPPPQGGYAPPPPGAGYPPPGQSAGLADNMAAALSYIPIVAIVFLVIEPFNRNRVVRFHSFQSLFYCAAAIVAEIAMTILSAAMVALPGIGFIFGGLLHMVVGLGIFVVWLILVYKAYNNEQFMLPVIGPMAQKQV